MKETKDRDRLVKSKTHFDLFSLEQAMSGLAFGDNEHNQQLAADFQSQVEDEASAVIAAEPSTDDFREASGKSLYELLDEQRAKSINEQQQVLKGLAANGFLTHNHSSQPLIVSEMCSGLKRRNFSFK